jgi:hypothetical protein
MLHDDKIESINAFVLKNKRNVFQSDYFRIPDRSLRWVLSKRREPDIAITAITLEQHMDAFIDRHLWFLPIPRFDRLDDSEIDNQRLVDGAFAALETICKDKMSYKTEKNAIAIIEEFYRIGWPHIAFLKRSGRRLLSAQAYVLCLMALNSNSMSKVSADAIQSETFLLNAQSILLEEMSLDFLDGPISFLCAVSEYIDKKSYDDILSQVPKAEANWLKVSDLKEQNLISDDLQEKLDLFQQFWSAKGLTEIVVCIKDLLNENPEIGIL